MHAHRLIETVFSLGAALAFGIPAMAADLPRSGTIKIHRNLEANEQVVQIGEKHFIASGNGWVVAYNDAGNGPPDMGAWFRTFTGDDVNGSFTNGDACVFGDAGGADEIFIVWSGKGTDNVGRTKHRDYYRRAGRCAGIEGKMVWQCKPVDAAQGLSARTQQFNYQLASTSANH
jgi:hypothetical protein